MRVNINIEDMPQSAQTAYARKNKLRGITMRICWALTPVLFVIFCIMSLVNKTFSEDIEFDLEVALTLGCGLQGLMHIGFFYKRAIRAVYGKIVELGILIGLFVLIPLVGVLIVVPAFGIMFGFVYEIVDTVLFLRKKPLVYQRELKHFIETKQAQAEIEAALTAEANSETVMANLQKLKEMAEQGVITEEEFNQKKAEMMARI